MASKDIPSLSQVFGRLRQAILFDSSTTTPTVPSGDTSAFATSMGSGRGGRGGRGRWSRGREQWGGGCGKGRVPLINTFIVMERIMQWTSIGNYMLGIIW